MSTTISVAPTFTAVAPHWWVTNLGGIVVQGIVAARSKSKFIKVGFALAATTHVVEAAYAYRTAKQRGLDDDAVRWGLQTLAVGFPSLFALQATLRGLDT